jgi:hypothetical protein
MTAMQHEPTLGLQLGETAGAHKVWGWHIHSVSYSVRREAAVNRQADADHEARGRAA